MGKVKCEVCRKKCSGDILKANDKFFHIACFNCKTCRRPLSELGYFVRDHSYYCPQDYHNQFGSKCASCNKYVEGDVVQCMGKTFHQQCFKCDRCRQPFAAGQKATFTSREHLCPKCAAVPVATVKPTQVHAEEQTRHLSPLEASSPTACAACNQTIHSGQILLALDTQWHIWCFKCTVCGSVLHGEYMAKDGLPYCIRDYNSLFGVRCHECENFIAGKVLQAGEYHFHPGCALCSRCNTHFEEREEMYMQGDEIWHARCNDINLPERIVHPFATLPRSASPLILRNLDNRSYCSHSLPRSPRTSAYSPKYTCDFGKFLTYMYLLPEGNVTYLKQPIPPHPPQTPQFHMPQGKPVKIRKSRVSMFKSGLQKLAEILDEQQPRPRSPHMNNEEPIELSHFPSARAPEPHEIPAIERDDFPAPPYPYAVEELKRRLSSSDLENEDEDLTDGNVVQKIKRAEEELTKIENLSSIAKVIVQSLEEQIKHTKSPLYHDPRSASRTPSAKKLPHLKCRYESPINASPSRYLSRPRPWDYWEKNRAVTATIPYPYYMQVPKPGYGLAPKAASLPGSYGYYYHDFHVSDLDTTRSSTLSDKSNLQLQTPTYAEFDRYQPSYGSGVLRSSLPDMSKPPKMYSYSTLQTTNRKLPEDVDRCHLERHLTKDEFERTFRMLPIEFYKLPEWKRITMKRVAKLY